ncbi:ABC transporter substrate-binding protein [Evansella sp. LMS18]|uniref:ABC transporter substrate-binding protein n=1 Tax=Evansella sp. LMS18 TaxID=2924033 RepID=UPI0020D08017|nr:ABC transporter substrate-binding protein [Evansella sp. LMS18]UTR12925.1 ABC transporter substrate-binding protein [Evansella sp. LMS18]
MRRLTLALGLPLLLLGACSSDDNNQSEATGSDSSSGDKIELSYWVPFSGSDGEFMEEMVREFNQSQDDIEVEFMNNNWDDFYPKLRTALVSNSAPDIAVSHVSNLAELIPTGAVEPLDELAEEAGLDWSTYSENQVDATLVDGSHYAVPLDTHAVIMYYNKELLDDAGLLNDDGSIMMEEGAEGFTNMLRILQDELPSDITPMVIGSNNIFTFWIWHALVSQQGLEYLDGDQVNIDSPESVTAMNIMSQWLEEDLMPADVGDNSYDIFKTGQAAVTFTGVWATGNFETEESLDFEAVPFPQLYDEPAAWGNSHTLIVPAQADREKQVAAVQFADWLAENSVKWAEAGHVPPKPSVIESAEYQELPYRPEYASVMDDVKYVPASDQQSAITDAILESLVKINYGQVSVEDGIKEAHDKVEALTGN